MNLDDTVDAPQLPEHDTGGAVFRLGTLVPERRPTRCPHILTAPGFRVWSKSEIEDAIRNKPVTRRKQFAGKDWILNQQQLGSCNCAAGVGALRRSMALGGWNDVPQLSWEFMYAQLVDGRDNGSMLDDGMNELETSGVPLLDTRAHPINRDYRKRDYSSAEYTAAKANRAEAVYQLSTGSAGELELATLLLSGQGAAVIAVDVGRRFGNLSKYGLAQDGGGYGNHAVCTDDVDLFDGELYFDVPNSWDTSWGDEGRCRVTWSNNLHRTGQEIGFYGILSASNPGTDAPKAS